MCFLSIFCSREIVENQKPDTLSSSSSSGVGLGWGVSEKGRGRGHISLTYFYGGLCHDLGRQLL